MVSVDLVDKRLLIELSANCRLSYQALADRVEVSAKAVKKRVTRLIESGILERFQVALAEERFGFARLFYWLSTNGKEDKDAFIQYLGATQPISSVARLVDGRYLGAALASRAEEVLKLDRVFRKSEYITTIELRHITVLRPSRLASSQLSSKPLISGGSLTFTKFQKQVLGCLVENPRMSITDIAQQTKLTPRRVRRILNELEEGGNIEFSIVWCLGAGENFDCAIRTKYNPNKGTPVELVDWFQERYPLEYWWSFFYVDEPIAFHKIVVDDLRVVEVLIDLVKDHQMVESADTLIYHTLHNFPQVNEIQLLRLLEMAD